MKICLNAGHTLTGKGCGAVGLLKESTEARKIVKAVSDYLVMKGHTVIIDNVDYAASQNEYLEKVVSIANTAKSDLFVSIHLNSGGGSGCEVYTWRGASSSKAQGVCDELNLLGFRNRGVKDGSEYYVIRKTIMPALLIEVCFVDNETDAELYKRLGSRIIAQAITRGIIK